MMRDIAIPRVKAKSILKLEFGILKLKINK